LARPEYRQPDRNSLKLKVKRRSKTVNDQPTTRGDTIAEGKRCSGGGIHRIGFLVQLRSPHFVLCGEVSKVPTNVREELDIGQQPKSFSRIAMVLSWGSSSSH